MAVKAEEVKDCFRLLSGTLCHSTPPSSRPHGLRKTKLVIENKWKKPSSPRDGTSLNIWIARMLTRKWSERRISKNPAAFKSPRETKREHKVSKPGAGGKTLGKPDGK